MPLTPSDYSEWQSHFIGQPQLQADEAPNDSDKTFTVPVGKVWEILSIWVELTSTASVGNRQISVQIQDSDSDVIGTVIAGINQAESLTRNYFFGAGVVDLTTARDTNFLTTPIPRILLPAGFIIRVYDNFAVDVAADDMVVQMMVAENTPAT